MDALGLTGIMHKLESAFHLEGLQRASGSLSGSSTKVSSYPQLKAAFGDFVSDPQQALMVAVVSAISGTVVRPGEPAPPLPPFPPDIQINGQTPPSTFLHSKMSVASSAYTPVVLHPFEPLIPGMVVISDADWPGVNTLLSDIAKTIESVKGIVPTGQTLDHALADVPNLEHAPQLLHSNLGDLFTIVKALHDLSSFLQEFPLLNVLLTPVTKSLSDEELAIQTLQRDTSQIVDYSNSIVTSIKLIMATEDSSLTNNLNQLMMTLQHWSHEIKSYTTQIDDGYARDAKLHNKYKQQLDSVKKKMLDRVADLAKVLASVSKLAEDLGNGGQKLSSEISELNTSLKSVQEPIYHLESAIVKVHSGVHVAQQLDSVFKPLQWLLTDFHCVPDKRPLKLEYLKFVKDFADGSSGLSIDKSAEAALKVLENEVFPIQSVSSTVKSAMSVLQSLSSSIPSQVTSYLSELKSLASTKIGSKTFTYRNPSGSVITIYSHFLDEGTVKEVLSLGKQLQDNPNII